jgi:hypothetical protein
MTKETLEIEIMKADIEIKKQHTALLKAQARRENAEAIRVEAINKKQ